MVKRAKRIQQLQEEPTDMRYSELVTVLEDFGATFKRSKGSHFVWKIEGKRRPLIVVVHDGVVEIEAIKEVKRIFGL